MAGIVISLLFAVSQLVSFSSAVPSYGPSGGSNVKTSLTLLYQNNLNATDDAYHVGAILLDPLDRTEAAAACKAIGESLITKATLEAHQSDFAHQLSYQAYAKRASASQLYWISSGVVVAVANSLSFPRTPAIGARLPALCTQSSNQDQAANAVATTSNKISVVSAENTYVGFRNQKSFRFLGFPYANEPARFTYSTLYSPKGKTLDATAYGSECAQGSSGSENCLFMNIQTPYIPIAGSRKNLRPVMFWIYGGGFAGGSSSDPLTDGGNLASREDIVVVSFNYRLSTVGFLAIPGTDIKGNFGISDQVTALEWVVANIADFGGDPTRITLNGESAGAGSVRALLGSPPAIGKFQGAIAMSNLGGGVTLGIDGGYATTYSSYLTIAASYAQAGQQIFIGANCTQSTLAAQIACLKKVPIATLLNLPTVARYVVQDGHFVNTEQLIVSKRNGSTAHVPVIFGTTRDDGASFCTYPKTPVTSELAGLQASLGISASYAQGIIDSKLFPLHNTGNITLDSFTVSARIATDFQFRCIDEATVYAGVKTGAFKKAYFYQIQRTINGYDPNGVGTPKDNNPNNPYFRVHGSDLPWMFGNLVTLRDPNDLYSIQLESGYFAEFIKSGQPNPDPNYLKVRGYTKTLQAIEETGPWNEIEGSQGPMKLLDYPAWTAPFQDVPQCKYLNYSLSYYLDSNRG